MYVYERSKSAIVGLNSRNDAVVEQRNGVQTDFAANTVLVELTGNAADPTVDPTNTIPEAIRVDGAGKINIRIPANFGHGRGYVVYGVAPPQGTMSLTNVAATLEGATASAANNGTARLSDIDVITANTFNVQLTTNPVTLPAPAGEVNSVRDVHADGDTAMIRIDGGLNINGVAGIDDVAPGSVGYGFEKFKTLNAPGYVWQNGANVGTGTGSYVQTIDATQLSEGRHYVTVRAFRHRDTPTGGDGGPAVFTDFKRTIYVDRLPPQSAIVSFDPFASAPNDPNNRDLIMRSIDGTANRVHVFLDLPPNTTDADVLQMALLGQNRASTYDRDRFVFGLNNLITGNHTATDRHDRADAQFERAEVCGFVHGYESGSRLWRHKRRRVLPGQRDYEHGVVRLQHGALQPGRRFQCGGRRGRRRHCYEPGFDRAGSALDCRRAPANSVRDRYDQLLVKRGDVNTRRRHQRR